MALKIILASQTTTSLTYTLQLVLCIYIHTPLHYLPPLVYTVYSMARDVSKKSNSGHLCQSPVCHTHLFHLASEIRDLNVDG